MARFVEADNRIFKGVYVCYKCKSKIRSSYGKIKTGNVKCRKCGYKRFRPKNKVSAKQ